MKKQIFTLLISSVLFVSCEDDDKPLPVPVSTIKAGSVFTFTRTDFDQTGAQVSVSDYAISLLRDTTINGEQWFVAEIKDTIVTGYTFLKFTSDGMYRDGATLYDLKFGANAKDTWTNSHNETVQVMGIDLDITVPGGTFTDVTYIEARDNSNNVEEQTWYNDEQFVIKHEAFADVPTQPGQAVIDYRDELKSVQLVK